MRTKFRLTQFIFKFSEALYKQLEGDQNAGEMNRRERPAEGQEDRIYSRFETVLGRVQPGGEPDPVAQDRGAGDDRLGARHLPRSTG